MIAPILAPVVTLIAWSLLMLVWLVAVRMPAMKAVGIDVKKVVGGRPGALDGVVADKAQWPAHNYIHLMEQPTLFYAICFVLTLLSAGGGYNLWLAWAYVGLRIVHSLVQATINRVYFRFMLFGLSTLVLIALVVQAARALIVSGSI
ncbi:MAPEG family protein [Sphingomonas sp. AOB5]|uniref:MAPEG family protein n=1 Tax=Sphingomonas sp. AOB5 TaxID=3034017 RepID=UPI0023F8D995|nr:MAPEG family protein [Sphingomonas sp. AOB5]MDF7776215.1 MAPEG family protein [Sphingomonas sp. AOB5]